MKITKKVLLSGTILSLLACSVAVTWPYYSSYRYYEPGPFEMFSGIANTMITTAAVANHNSHVRKLEKEVAILKAQNAQKSRNESLKEIKKEIRKIKRALKKGKPEAGAEEASEDLKDRLADLEETISQIE